jgi:hypothetical protein
MTRAARQVVGRSGGKVVTEADLDRMVRESETGYDVDEILRRRRRPAMESSPTAVLPVGLDPELREAVEARAKRDDTSASPVIRRAIRAYLRTR